MPSMMSPSGSIGRERKRSLFSEDEEGSSASVAGISSSLCIHPTKRSRLMYAMTYGVSIDKLDAAYSSEGEETIYSEQGYDTVPIDCMTDDIDIETTTDSSDSESEYEQVYSEYEVDSEAYKEEKTDGDSSSEDSDFQDMVIVASAARFLDEDGWADSESDFELSNFDPEVGPQAAEVWKCEICNVPNAPFMRFCHKCWKERKGWLPSRKTRKRKNKRTQGQAMKRSLTSGRPQLDRSISDPGKPRLQQPPQREVDSENEAKDVEVSNKLQASTSSTDSIMGSQDSGFSGSQNMEEPSCSSLMEHKTFPKSNVELCTFCLTREKDAGFVHGGIIHQVCCYPCAKRLFKRRQSCPVCRRKIEKIGKIID